MCPVCKSASPAKSGCCGFEGSSFAARAKNPTAAVGSPELCAATPAALSNPALGGLNSTAREYAVAAATRIAFCLAGFVAASPAAISARPSNSNTSPFFGATSVSRTAIRSASSKRADRSEVSTASIAVRIAAESLGSIGAALFE